MSELKGGHKDTGKPRFDLLDPAFLVGVAEVLTFGAQKYGDRNWTGGIAVSRLFGSAQRHLWAYWGGQDLDPESGLPHLHHAACNLMMLSWMHANVPAADDRPASEARRDVATVEVSVNARKAELEELIAMAEAINE